MKVILIIDTDLSEVVSVYSEDSFMKEANRQLSEASGKAETFEDLEDAINWAVESEDGGIAIGTFEVL